MGGTRFAGIGEAVRIGRMEHDDVADAVIAALSAQNVHATVIPHLRGKTDFGDVDLVCRRSQSHHNVPGGGEEAVLRLGRRDQAIASALDAIAHDRGPIANPTLHLLLKGSKGPVQVDITSIDDHLFDFALAQLSWGDAGSISAIVARQMGLKMGMHGLVLTIDDERGMLQAPLPLSHAEALTLIGYDPRMHVEGFETNEDVYRWVASGTYFDPRIWQFDRLTNSARHRAWKRPSYQAWVSWMDKQGLDVRYDWGEIRGARTQEWRGRLLQMFPLAAEEIERQRMQRRSPDARRTFFSGSVISEMTGVKGPDLQHLMNAIRKEIGQDGIERMAHRNDREGLCDIARRLATT